VDDPPGEPEFSGSTLDHLDWFEQLLGQTALIEGDAVEGTGTVEYVDGTTVTVLPDGGAWSMGDRRHVTVSVFAPDAMYRLIGDAVSEEKTLRCSDMVIERIQRRKWPRLRIDLPVTLCPVDDAASVHGVPGRTIDLSVGGACVETLRPVEGEGDPMVMLRLPDGASVVCAATTVAAEELHDGWRYRLAFRDLDSGDAARLQTLTTSGARTES
jgi:hypothetical protein